MDNRTGELIAAIAQFLRQSDETLDDLLLEIVSLGVQLIAADEGSILLLKTDGNRSYLEFAKMVAPHEVQSQYLGKPVPLGEGQVGLAALTGEPQVGPTLYKELQQARVPQEVMAVPLISGDETLGVLSAIRYESAGGFTQSEVDLYIKFTRISAQIIDYRQRQDALKAFLSGAAAEGPFNDAGDSSDDPIRKAAVNLYKLSNGSPEKLAMCAEVMDLLVRIAAPQSLPD